MEPSPLPSSTPTACPVTQTTNVALAGVSSQSSNYNDNNHFVSSKAIDGEKRTEVELGHENGIIHTDLVFEPWWKLDLDAQYYISQVIIYNRQHDTYSKRLEVEKRLQGFRVEIFNGDDTNAVWTYNDPTPSASSPGPEILINIPICVLGDRVKISIPGKSAFLHLREVEVFASSTSNGCPTPTTNVALGRTSSQSSNLYDNTSYASSKAVDGVTKSEIELELEEYGNSGNTHTKDDYEPWWQVDLGAQYYISHVLIYNRVHREDSNFELVLERLRGFRVELFDGDVLNPVWTYNDPTPSGSNPGTVIRIDIPICMLAERIKVSIPEKRQYLHLREVEVYGLLPISMPSTSPAPSAMPTLVPSSMPSASTAPSAMHTLVPSSMPTSSPSDVPTSEDTVRLTVSLLTDRFPLEIEWVSHVLCDF